MSYFGQLFYTQPIKHREEAQNSKVEIFSFQTLTKAPRTNQFKFVCCCYGHTLKVRWQTTTRYVFEPFSIILTDEVLWNSEYWKSAKKWFQSKKKHILNLPKL